MNERVSVCVYGGDGSGFDNRWLVLNSSLTCPTHTHTHKNKNLSLLSSSVAH